MSKLQMLSGQKEAVFILPDHTPDGDLKMGVHYDLLDVLSSNFLFCYTYFSESVLNRGDGEDDIEHDASVVTYHVVLGNTVSEVQKLVKIVGEAGEALKQKQVYLRHPNGECGFIEIGK